MYRPGIRRAAVTAAALAAPLAALTVAAPLASAAPAAARGQAAATSGASSPLLLISGDRVVSGRGGPHAVPVAQGPGTVQAVVFFAACGQRSEVPATALPYLGRGLDPSLFRLTALGRAERGGRLPVRISYHGALPALPGITITRSRHGLADGYLTAASARRFGAALRRQFLADHARGSYGTDGLFANGVSIGLPGATAPARAASPARARPDFPEHILTVKGTNLAGRPDTGDVADVFDVNNCFRLVEGNVFVHGVTRFAVPSGHDWAVGVYDTDSGLRVAVLPQFTVNRDRTVHLDERTASSKITFSTPRPATTGERSITLVRSSRSTMLSLGWEVAGGELWVSPVRRPPSFGTLQAYINGQLGSRPGPGIPYGYALNFAAPPGTIPAREHYVARPADLATVRESYFQDVPGTGGWLTFGGTPAELAAGGGFGVFLPVHMPGRQIQYLTARPRTLWQTETPGPDFSGGQAGPLRSYRAGQQASADWNRYPLHPAPNVVTPGGFPVPPSASRAGDLLTLDITPFSDSEAGHIASPFSGFSAAASGRYALFQDGRKIASGDAARAARRFADLLLTAKLSARPSAIRFALTATRASRRFALSATSTDVWTWRSRRDPAATVPAAWACGVTADRTLSGNRRCAVQGMLTARYHVAGLSLTGAARPGRQQIGLTISRLQLAAPSRITQVTLHVSYDHGKTWHPATITRLASGSFRIAFTAPAKALVTLRTHAADAAGDTITETITDAYRTSPAAG